MVKTKAQQQNNILQNSIERRQKKKNYSYDEIKIEFDNCEFGESEFCYLFNGPSILLISSDEKFKYIVDYEEMYLISNFGRIYSNYSNKFLKISDFFEIGKTINLSKNGVIKTYLISDLLEEHFNNEHFNEDNNEDFNEDPFPF